MERYAIWCPACGEVGVTESRPAGDGDVACLYCGGDAKWWPFDEAGEVMAPASGEVPEFVRSMIRQMIAVMR